MAARLAAGPHSRQNGRTRLPQKYAEGKTSRTHFLNPTWDTQEQETGTNIKASGPRVHRHEVLIVLQGCDHMGMAGVSANS